MAIGENVAFGYNTSQAAVEAWSKSKAHEKNMIGDYTHFGISVLAGEEGKQYFTNIFIRR